MPLDPNSANLVNEALMLFNQAKEFRKPLIRKWVRNYNIVHNRTWGSGRASYHPQTEIPEVRPILLSLVAWEMDTPPVYDFMPYAPPDSVMYDYYDEIADDLKFAYEATWNNNDYEVEVQQILMDGETYGIGYGKNEWEATLTDGLGEVMMRHKDPFTIYLDPDATSWKDIKFICEARVISTDELRRRFPKFRYDGSLTWASQMDESPNQVTGFTTNPGNIRNNPAILTPGVVTSMGGPGPIGKQVIEAGVSYIEIWYRSLAKARVELPLPTDTLALSPNEDDIDVDDPPGQGYMDEWYCLVLAGSQVIMHKKARDIFPFNRHPYERYVPTEEGELYGYSLVEELGPLQLSINRLISSMEHNLWLAGNPIFVGSGKGDLGRTTIYNKPGERITVQDPNNDVRWMDPPTIAPQHLQTVQFLVGEMERISGMSAIVRGFSPTGRNAQGVLDSVQDSAFVRVRARLRNFERFLRQMGYLNAATMAEFYDVPRFVGRVGNDGQKMGRVLKSQHFYLPTKQGKEPMRFMLNVVSGATQSISRQARVEDMKEAYAMGIVDEHSVLEVMGIPDSKKIADRVVQQKAMAGTLGEPPTQRAADRR